MKKEKEQKKLKERGITLIALVITIILLLILAGVTLKIVLDDNFVDKTQLAVDKYSEAQKNETEQIKYFLENYLGEVDNTEGTEHRTLNGADPAYNNPIIPVGFKTSSEGASWMSSDGKTVQGWNDGLVIEDKDGNQFVWVPVDGTEVKYEKWCTTEIAYNDINITGDELPSGVSSEQEQINRYGGFYIGRYEAGIPESMTEAITTANADKRNKSGEGIVPIVKKDQVPWNFIDYNNAKTNAENMYTGENIKSGLLTGKMWDTTMKWLENSGVNVTTDCTGWANYDNSAVTGITKYSIDYGANWIDVSSMIKDTSCMLKTGNSEYTKRKNIYDLAGNEYEWTSEIYDSKRIIRGGSYKSDGKKTNATTRQSHDKDYAGHDFRSFRVALYIE